MIQVGNTPAQALAWAKSGAAATHDGGSWDGWCESAVNRAVGANGGFDYASDQGDASAIISNSPSNAPAGAIHHWRHQPALKPGGHGRPGHTSINLAQGPYSLMASTWADSHPKQRFHPALGTVNTGAYSKAHPGMVYLGWSLDFGGLFAIKGAFCVVKIAGKPELYKLAVTGGRLTQHHLTPAQWAPMREKGQPKIAITAARLGQFARI